MSYSITKTTTHHSFRRRLASVGAAAMLALGTFGAISSTEAHAAGVKTSNYVVATTATQSGQASTTSGKGRED